MFRSIAIMLILLVSVLMTVGASAATWVWSDGDFPDADWDIISWYPPQDSGESDATQVLTIGHAGNPAAMRASSVWLGDGPNDGGMIVQLNNQWILDPATSGPVLEIDGGLDFLKSIDGPSRLGLAVQQDGEIFVHVLNPQAADATWTTYYHSILTADDFAPIDPNESGQPDFSSTGSPLKFGFTTGQIKPHDDGYTAFHQYVDNVLLVMTTGPVSAVGQDFAGLMRVPVVAPNPFNPATRISFEMPSAGLASLRVYDLGGHLVKILASRQFTRGTHAVTWRGDDGAGRALASGVYMVVLETAEGSVSQRITLAK